MKKFNEEMAAEMRLKQEFVRGSLNRAFNDKEAMDKIYNTIIDNTEVVESEKAYTIIDTSNVLASRNLEIGDLLKGEEKERYDGEALTNPNYEATDYTYLVPFSPRQNTSNFVCDYTNKTTCLSAIIPNNSAELAKEFAQINYLTKEKAVEAIKKVGYSHLPLDENAAQSFLSSKVGTGKSLNSILNIPNGKLKRELSDICIALSGANIESNDGGFFKVVYGQGVAYLTNYKDLHADKATNLLVEHFKKIGYDDITFNIGYLEKYYYISEFSSKKLGEEILSVSKIEGYNPKAIIVFKTSDYGLSSLNITPFFEFEIESGVMKTRRRVVINLSDVIYLNHNASIEDEKLSMEDLWLQKCASIFACAKETAEALNGSDKVTIKYPRNAIKNLLDSIGANTNFDGKEDIIDEFVNEFSTDCTARDLYIYAFSALMEWEKSNKTSSLKAKDRLTRVLLNKTWSKYDTI